MGSPIGFSHCFSGVARHNFTLYRGGPGISPLFVLGIFYSKSGGYIYFPKLSVIKLHRVLESIIKYHPANNHIWEMSCSPQMKWLITCT